MYGRDFPVMRNRPSMICCSPKIFPKKEIQEIKQVAVDLLQKVKVRIAKLDH